MLDAWRAEADECWAISKITWEVQAQKTPHTPEVSSHLNIELIRRIAVGELKNPLLRERLRGYPDSEIADRLLRGHSVLRVPHTGLHHRLTKSPRQYEPVPSFRFKSTRPSWQDEDLIVATKTTVEKERKTGLFGREVSRAELEPLVESGDAHVHTLFSIQQPEKVRTVCFYQQTNPKIAVPEEMKLPNHAFLAAWFAGMATGAWLMAECARAVSLSLQAARQGLGDWYAPDSTDQKTGGTAAAERSAVAGVGDDENRADEETVDDRDNNDAADAGVPSFESNSAWAPLYEMQVDDRYPASFELPQRFQLRLTKRDFKSAFARKRSSPSRLNFTSSALSRIPPRTAGPGPRT